jgi:hypothetical protein
VTLPTRRPGGFGGGGGNGGPPTGATGATGPTGRPGGFFSGANSAKFRTAQTACSKLLPAGFGRGGFFGRGGGGGGNSTAFAAYRNCLMLHGVKLGAGFERRGGQGGQGAQGAPKPNAKVTKALAACASLRPSFGGGPPGSTTTTPTTATA